MNTEQLRKFLIDNQGETRAWLAKETGRSTRCINEHQTRLRNEGKIPPATGQGVKKTVDETKKKGVEIRQDGAIIINWTNQTIITDLGEWDNFVCSFSTHNAIQRMYSNEFGGKGATQSEIARRFDFPHAKAFALYAKIHGYTKSDLGQSDIEFEMGLTPEKAVEENLQALKRRAFKLTEQKKWKLTQEDADKWNNFEHSTLYPMMDAISSNLPNFKYKPVKVAVQKSKDIAVVGISDLHYMKQCFDDNGNDTYNREITVRVLNEANASLIAKMKRYGTPAKFIIPAGTDNLHVDGITHTTTAGTPQARQTTGDWEVHIKNYVELFMQMVEQYARIAPVELIVMPGNHDYQTSRMLGVLLEMTYKSHPRITVVHKPTAVRIYRQNGSACLIFAHGEGESLAKQDRSIHSKYLAEARAQGINLQEIKTIVYYHGHVHTYEAKDLSGITRVAFPSLATEDQWHKMAGYVGNTNGALIDLVSPVNGRSAMFFS